MTFPSFTPNTAFALALRVNGHADWADRAQWAARHYAVDNHAYPEAAAQDAAAMLACYANLAHI